MSSGHILGWLYVTSSVGYVTSNIAYVTSLLARDSTCVPFDHNRVKLRHQENDYVNASWIRSEGR